MEIVNECIIVSLYIIMVILAYGALQYTSIALALKEEKVNWKVIQIGSAFFAIFIPYIALSVFISKFDDMRGFNFKIFHCPYDELALQEVDFTDLLNIWKSDIFKDNIKTYWDRS